MGPLLLTAVAVCLVPVSATRGQAATAIAPAAQATEAPKSIPPFESIDGNAQVSRERTRQERFISAAAPIAMILVLAAGLYVYWLIRKGL